MVRVEELIADADLKVQMRTGCSPGRADESYLVRLEHLLTWPNQHPARMGVMSEYVAAVVNKDCLTVTAKTFTAPCGDNCAVRARKNGVALTRGYI